MPNDLSVNWRDSALVPKFYCFDARVALSVILFFLNMALWTLAIVIALIVASSILNYYKMPLIVVFRIIRDFLVGRKKVIFKYE